SNMHLASRVGVGLLAFIVAETSAAALEPHRPGQENSLTRAIFAEGRLWLRSDAGELFSIVPGADTRVGAALPEPAVDICARDGHIEAVTCSAASCKSWTLRHWTGDKWLVVASIATGGDELVAVDCAGTTTTLLTTRRLVEGSAAGQRVVSLSEALEG